VQYLMNTMVLLLLLLLMILGVDVEEEVEVYDIWRSEEEEKVVV